MVNIIGELEDTASSPSQTPLILHTNDDGLATKRKRGLTKCLKTHGLSYEDRLPIRLNKHGQPIGCNCAKLSSHLGTLVRNARLAPLTYTSWHGLKDNWKDLWEATICRKSLTSEYLVKCGFSKLWIYLGRHIKVG
ncbi:hypothetical protein HN51_066751 [Arachis hypogaea]